MRYRRCTDACPAGAVAGSRASAGTPATGSGLRSPRSSSPRSARRLRSRCRTHRHSTSGHVFTALANIPVQSAGRAGADDDAPLRCRARRPASRPGRPARRAGRSSSSPTPRPPAGPPRQRPPSAPPAKGLPAVGVLDSSQYASLQPGYFVVFSGIYDSQAEANGRRFDGPFGRVRSRVLPANRRVTLPAAATFVTARERKVESRASAVPDSRFLPVVNGHSG